MSKTIDKPAEEPKKFYSPPVTVLLTLVIYFGSQFMAGFLISIIPVAKDWTNRQITDWLTNNPWATFGFMLLLQAMALLLVHFFLKQRQQSFKFIGFNRPIPKHALYALVGYGIYFLLYVVGLTLVKVLIPELDLDKEQEIGFSTTTTGINLLPVFISLVILPPLAEEIVARGFLFTGLRTKLPFIYSTLIVSLLFAAAHLNGAKEGLLWVAAIDTLILSFVLCYLRDKTGSLWPSIGVHMLKNAVAFVILFNIVDVIR